jgi:hypothetical protein
VSANRIDSKLIDAAAGVLKAAMAQGNREAYSLAFALDSACMLQSPESAAEARQLRDDITGACLARYEEEQENARLRLAWKSARERAEAYGQAIQRHVADRDSWKGWAKEAQAEVARLRVEAQSVQRLDEVATARGREANRLMIRVAELEAERHSTNEALSDAAEQLRVQRDRIAELEALTPAPIQTCQTCGAGYTYGEPCSVCAFHVLMEIAQKKQRQPEDPHTSELHHTYEIGRDLPFIPGQRDGEAL